MHVDVIASRDALLRLRSNWDAVYQADPEAQLFMSWTWISGWFERLGSQWLVLAAKDSLEQSDYVAFFPLQLRTERNRDGTFHNELRSGGGYFAGYTGFLCDPRFEHAIRAFADHTSKRNWSRLHLENILASPGRLSLFLNEFSSPQFVTEKVQRPDDGDGIDHDIYVYVNLPISWDAFLKERLSGNTRRNARVALRTVESGGEFRITHPTAETIEEDVEALLKLWEGQWAAKLAARYNPRLPYGMMNNFRHMLKCCFDGNALLLPILWKGTNRIGLRASLIDWKNRSLICFFSGRDLSVKTPPPGFVLHLHCIRWGIENGFTLYDLQTGNFSYKYDFGGLERRIECLRVTTHDQQNLRGKLDPMSLPVVFGRAQRLRKDGKLSTPRKRAVRSSEPNRATPMQHRLLNEIEAELQRALPAGLSSANSSTSVDRWLRQRTRIARSSRRPEQFRSRLSPGGAPSQAAQIQIGGTADRAGHSHSAQRCRFALQPWPCLDYLARGEEALASFNAAIALKPDYDLAITQRDILKNRQGQH